VTTTRIPAALKDRIQPRVPVRVIIAQARYAQAMNAARTRVSAERFEDLVYDLAARDASLTERVARDRLQRLYEVGR
jgi:hypothetical protein